MKINGAKALVKTLEKIGVEVIFGIPGGATLFIYDALKDSKSIRHILMRHEQCAAHAADGYARASGKVGVCMATSGPGATNLVTGIANAYMDSIPIVAITGQVSTPVIGTDAFQEADTTGITLPIVKHSYLVTDVNELPEIIREAFIIAESGRKGPVVIDVPKDITFTELDYDFPEKVDLPGYKPNISGHIRQIKQAAVLIVTAKKPLFFIGGGVVSSDSSKELGQFIEYLNAPATYTLMGKGAFPDDHRLNIGMIGMHGTRTANYSMQECDLIIGIGVRFDDRATGRLKDFAPKAKVIHLDIDPAEIGKNVAVDVPIVGDAKSIMKQLLREVKELSKKKKRPDCKPWHAKIKNWDKKYPLGYADSRGESIKPQFVVEKINELIESKESIVTTGVGQNQMFAAQYINSRMPRRFISSGGLGTMGFGLPSAIGAQVARPDAVVFDIDGDGSLQMVSQELATSVCNKLPLNIVVLNNGYLGMVRQWQELFYKKCYFAVDLDVGTPDFVKLAEAYGALGIRVKKKKELVPALKKAIKSPKTVLLDITVEREENIWPMVSAGASLSEVFGGIEK